MGEKTLTNFSIYWCQNHTSRREPRIIIQDRIFASFTRQCTIYIFTSTFASQKLIRTLGQQLKTTVPCRVPSSPPSPRPTLATSPPTPAARSAGTQGGHAGRGRPPAGEGNKTSRFFFGHPGCSAFAHTIRFGDP